MNSADKYKKNVLWNAIAGLINASEAVIVLAVVSRVNGLREAGILTLAFSLANLFMTIGKFGIRNYQIAHEGEDFSFKTFLTFRIITVSVMFIITFVYVAYYFMSDRYTLEKSLAIFFVCMWYAVEAFEDVYVAKYQVLGRLDVGSKIFSVRWIATIFSFIVLDIILRNIVIAAAIAFMVDLILGIVLITYTYVKYKKPEYLELERGIKVLFIESIALCVSSFLYIYMTNVSKYIISSQLGDEVQAIYGYISMPVFVISLLNSFVYQPQLTAYVAELRENKIPQFVKRIMRQLIILFLIIAACLIGAYILGIPVLSVLYHADLREYKIHLLVLLLGAGFFALGAFMANMLIIADEQRKGMIGYLLVSISEYVLINALVDKFGLFGAVWGYTISMFFMAVLFSGILIVVIRGRSTK